MIPVTLARSSDAILAGKPFCPECTVRLFDTNELVVYIFSNYYHPSCALKFGSRITRRAGDGMEQYPTSN